MFNEDDRAMIVAAIERLLIGPPPMNLTALQEPLKPLEKLADLDKNIRSEDRIWLKAIYDAVYLKLILERRTWQARNNTLQLPIFLTEMTLVQIVGALSERWRRRFSASGLAYEQLSNDVVSDRLTNLADSLGISCAAGLSRGATMEFVPLSEAN